MSFVTRGYTPRRNRVVRRVQRRVVNPSGLRPTGRSQSTPRTGIKPYKPYQGISRTTTGLPEQGGSGGGGAFGLLGMKDAWTRGKQQGQDIRDLPDNIEKGWGEVKDVAGDAGDWLSKTWSDSPLGEATSGLSTPVPRQLPVLSQAGSGTGLASVPKPPTDFSIVDGQWTSLGSDPVGINSAFSGNPNFDPSMGSEVFQGSEGMGSLDGSQMQGGDAMGSLGKAMPYINIAKDMFTGADPQMTGSMAGDAALRTALAYATGGLSELGYSVYRMFS